MITIPNLYGWKGASLILKNLPSKLYRCNDELLFWPLKPESTIDLVFFVSERHLKDNKKQDNKKPNAILLTITATSKKFEIAVKKYPDSKFFFSGVFVEKVLKMVEKEINMLLSDPNNQLN